MTVEEMRSKGMAENANGYWVTSLMSEEEKAKSRARWDALKTKTSGDVVNGSASDDIGDDDEE